MEDCSCFHDSFALFKKDNFFLSEIGPKILDKMQEIYESKEMSAILRADRYLDENERTIVENNDEMKALQKAKFLIYFENDENESVRTEDDIRSENADSSDMNKEFINEENGFEQKWKSKSQTFKKGNQASCRNGYQEKGSYR